VTKKTILAACCVLGLTTAAAIPPQAHAQALTPITISYQPTNYWALPFYVASKKGWWKEVGLDPKFVLFPAGVPQVAAAAAGVARRRGEVKRNPRLRPGAAGGNMLPA
jgi:NitT/TauT family transport system substrate-binding protein